MHLTELRYLLTVIEAGSFGRAAQSLHLQVSTLSRAISRLEDRLGVTLLERTPAGIRATASGRLATRYIRRVLHETHAMKDTLARGSVGETGEIRLGLHLPPISPVLMAMLREWRTSYPGVIVVPCEFGEESLHAVLAGCRVDVALIPDCLLQNHETAVRVYAEPLVAVLPAGHHLIGQNILHWASLENEILLLGASGKGAICRDFYMARLPGARLHILEASILSVLAFVRAGFGITIAAQAYSALKFPGLAFIPIDEDTACLPVSLAWRPESEDPVIGKFVAFVRGWAAPHSHTPPLAATSPFQCPCS